MPIGEKFIMSEKLIIAVCARLELHDTKIKEIWTASTFCPEPFPAVGGGQALVDCRNQKKKKNPLPAHPV